MIVQIFSRIRNFMRRITLAGWISLGIGSFYFYRLATYKIIPVNFDVFRKTIESGLASECFLLGTSMYFRGFISDQWYKTEMGQIGSRHQMLALAASKPHTIVTNIPLDDQFIQKAVTGTLQ